VRKKRHKYQELMQITIFAT